MRAIVLSGGGAKGAYEVGVWKALRKLKIKYDIVTGTSIGALNGMMMAQNEFYNCITFWKNISFEQLYDNFETTKEKKDIYKNYLDKIIDGGIDTHKIEKIINHYYKKNKLYNSKVAFGVASYNVSDMEVVYSTNKNTRPNILKKHILASATCYPAFKPTKIGKDIYIDGGVYDNMPLNLAVELGADEIIAVDLKAIGIKRNIKNKDIPVTYIEPKDKLESFLIFDANSAKKMIKLGYNDTMKVFKKYEGDLYTFKMGTTNIITKKYGRKLNKLIEKHNLNNKFTFLEIVENALELLEIPTEKVYSDITCNKTLLTKLQKIEDIDIKDINIEEIKKIFDNKVIVKYIYTKLKKHDKINSILLNVFLKEALAAVYLIAIGS